MFDWAMASAASVNAWYQDVRAGQGCVSVIGICSRMAFAATHSFMCGVAKERSLEPYLGDVRGGHHSPVFVMTFQTACLGVINVFIANSRLSSIRPGSVSLLGTGARA